MNASSFRTGSVNPRVFLHINNGKGLAADAYAANGIRYLDGTYPNNGGFIEATENFEIIPEKSAWYAGPGTYTFEYRLLVDEGKSGCQRMIQSTPVSVTISNPARNTELGDCTKLTNILTLLQSSTIATASTPIQYLGVFRMNAEKFRSNAGNPQSETYINGKLLSSYSPSGFRYRGGNYPTNAGFLEATEFLEITPKGSAWYQGPGIYTIEHSLKVDNGISDCQRTVRSIPVTVRITDESTTSQSISLVVAPNPTANELQIDITVSKETPMECGIYDVAGRKVLSVFNGISGVGKLSFKVSLKDLAQGTYFYKVLTPTEAIQQQIQLIR